MPRVRGKELWTLRDANAYAFASLKIRRSLSQVCGKLSHYLGRLLAALRQGFLSLGKPSCTSLQAFLLLREACSELHEGFNTFGEVFHRKFTTLLLGRFSHEITGSSPWQFGHYHSARCSCPAEATHVACRSGRRSVLHLPRWQGWHRARLAHRQCRC